MNFLFRVDEVLLASKEKERFKFYSGDYNRMVLELNSIDWTNLFDNKPVNSCYELFLKKYTRVCHSCIPKTSKQRRLNCQPWLDDAARAALRTKHNYFYSNKFRRNSESKKEFNRICSNVKKQVKRSTFQYENNLVDKAKDCPKILFSYVKRKQNAKTELRALKTDQGRITTDKSEMAGVLNDQFKSVFVQRTDRIVSEI
jgi:hypothetical protein